MPSIPANSAARVRDRPGATGLKLHRWNSSSTGLRSSRTESNVCSILPRGTDKARSQWPETWVGLRPAESGLSFFHLSEISPFSPRRRVTTTRAVRTTRAEAATLRDTLFLFLDNAVADVERHSMVIRPSPPIGKLGLKATSHG